MCPPIILKRCPCWEFPKVKLNIYCIDMIFVPRCNPKAKEKCGGCDEHCAKKEGKSINDYIEDSKKTLCTHSCVGWPNKNCQVTEYHSIRLSLFYFFRPLSRKATQESQ